MPKCKPFWNSLYDQIEWKEVWKLPSKYCLTNKVNEVTYTVINLIYPVKQVVANIFRDMETIFCNLEEESIKHVFYDCIFTQMFWIDIEYLIFKFIKLLSGKYIFLLYKNKNLCLEQNFVILMWEIPYTQIPYTQTKMV